MKKKNVKKQNKTLTMEILKTKQYKKEPYKTFYLR